MKPRLTSIPFRPRTVLGVDLDGNRVICVEATRRHGRIELKQRSDAFAAPGPGNPVAACLLQREGFVRWLTAPLASASKAEKVFPSLLDIQLPFSLETCEFSVVDIQSAPDRRTTLGLVTGARHVDIDARLTTLNRLGITPRILDQEGLALWTQLQAEYPALSNANTASAVLYCASDRCTLAVGRGSSLLGAHTMKEADPDLVRRILKSYFPEPPSTFLWFLAGPAALSHEAAGRLQTIPAHFGANPAKVVRDPETFLARALATRALTPGYCRCNLLSGKFLHPEDLARQKRHPYVTAALFLCTGLALCLTTLSWHIAVRQRTAAMQRELKDLAVAIAGSPSLIQNRQEVLSAKRVIENQGKLYSPFMAPFIPTLPDTLKAVLSACHQNSITIESMTMSRQSVIAHGFAAKWSQCEHAATSLSGAGWTAQVTRKDTVAGETRVAFVLRMTPSHETR
jgi:hypothetical protein